jgi:hypothetical protein
MKYIFLLSTSLILLSCSKSKKVEKNVIGTWNLSEFYYSLNYTSQTETIFSDTTVYNVQGNLAFNSNGTGKFDIPSFYDDSFNWTNDKENIYIETNNDIDTFNIIEISKNKLIIQMQGSGMSSTGLESYVYRYTLTK